MTSSAPDEPTGDLIEEYLDRLLVSLAGSPRQIRHTLAEVEAHLRDAVAEGIAAGLPEQAAQAQALERIGPLPTAGRSPVIRALPPAALARRLVLTAALIGSAGLIAIGGASLAGRLLLAARGNLFMTAPWPPGSYTRADCVRWLAGDPGTRSCVAAMLADHAGDFLLEATAAGLLGLIAGAGYLVLRSRWRDRATRAALPVGTGEFLGAILAGAAALVLFGSVLDIETVQHGLGAGEPLSLGIAALVAAVGFGLALLVSLRKARQQPAGEHWPQLPWLPVCEQPPFGTPAAADVALAQDHEACWQQAGRLPAGQAPGRGQTRPGLLGGDGESLPADHPARPDGRGRGSEDGPVPEAGAQYQRVTSRGWVPLRQVGFDQGDQPGQSPAGSLPGEHAQRDTGDVHRRHLPPGRRG
jgi:hypothetical protein